MSKRLDDVTPQFFQVSDLEMQIVVIWRLFQHRVIELSRAIVITHFFVCVSQLDGYVQGRGIDYDHLCVKPRRVLPILAVARVIPGGAKFGAVKLDRSYAFSCEINPPTSSAMSAFHTSPKILDPRQATRSRHPQFCINPQQRDVSVKELELEQRFASERMWIAGARVAFSDSDPGVSTSQLTIHPTELDQSWPSPATISQRAANRGSHRPLHHVGQVFLVLA